MQERELLTEPLVGFSRFWQFKDVDTHAGHGSKTETIDPGQNAKIYQKNYTIYQGLYPKLKETFKIASLEDF